MESEKMTIGNVKDRSDIELELDTIADFIVEIKVVNNSNAVFLKTDDVLTKSDFEKLKKYFEKYDYEFYSAYGDKDCLVLYYKPIKERLKMSNEIKICKNCGKEILKSYYGKWYHKDNINFMCHPEEIAKP